MMTTLITPIVCDTITRRDSRITALAVELPHKKVISSTVKALLPLPTKIKHCKRVRVTDKEGILCLIGEEDRHHFEEDKIHSLSVPEFPPLTRSQFDESKVLWPVHFHPEPRLEELLAKETPGIWDKADTHSKYMFERKEAALIVDPNGDVMACGEDTRDTHPLQHPALNAIKDLCRKKDSDYLATGLDIYLESEPCAMCAMALVHMRIKRIFFSEENPKLGALKSKMKLHTLPGINHVFQVFQINRSTTSHDDDNICTET